MSTAGQAGEAVLVRERARLLAPVHVPVEPPRRRVGYVDRVDLVRRLSEAQETVALVVAPAGYGKTTLLTQYAVTEERPVAWLALSEPDNDPPSLLAHLLLALDGIETTEPSAFDAIVFSQAELDRVLPRLVAVVGELPPFVLAVDDAHVIRSTTALAILRVVVEHLPPGSRSIIASRAEPALPLARWRANRDVVEVRTDDLKMSVAEGAALFRAVDAEVSAATAAALVDATEGWPAGLYLSTLALRDNPDLDLAGFGGDERAVAAYFIQEVLRAESEEHVEFLTRASVLEKLSGDKCDAVLERSGSAEVLDQLERSNLFVIALGRDREWYRFHRMFRDLLRAELHRREPESEPRLLRAASEWWEGNGEPDTAIAYARRAGDADRVSTLVWTNLMAYVGSGRTATVQRWLEPFTEDEIAARPALALAAAWAAFTGGNTEDLDRWATILQTFGSDERLPDGAPLAGAVALVQAQIGANGLTAARDAADVAYRQYPDGPTHAVACVFSGLASRLLGDSDAARARCREGLHLGIVYMPIVAAHCTAQLALLDAETGDWTSASRMADDALRLVEEYEVEERPAVAEIFGAVAYVHARDGRSDVRDLVKRGVWLVSRLVGVAVYGQIDARILLARALTTIGDAAMARTLLVDAQALLDRYPDSGRLPELLADAQSHLDAVEVPLGVAAAPLTPAELRVLRYLPTHLSFAEIADQVYVSRNTVKTQAIAVYRKLGVSSRTAAVDRAREAGLLDP